MPTTVFISYARSDDEGFVARLHADLTTHGFDVWFDRVNMPSRALTFHQEIKDAIRIRDRLVLVVGPKAVTSNYVIEEWLFAWRSEKPVVPILRLGDYTLVPELLKFYHCEDFRDEEVRGYDFHLAQLIRILTEPEPPLGKLTAVPNLPPHFLAQPERLRSLRDAVITDLHKPEVNTGAALQVGLYGMGGIGKSVLAAVLAHDRLVRQSFPDGIVWLALGQQPNVIQVQRNAAVAFGGDGLFEYEYQGKAQLRELLLNKAALIVLDDAWDTRHLVAFDVLGARCRALVTTRDVGLLHNLGATAYRVDLLSDTDALALLAKWSGHDLASLPGEAREVARECDHLPLALALCGGMAFGPEGIRWSTILKALHAADLEHIATDYPLTEQHASLWKAIALSVQQLTCADQQRWAELSIFPEDETIPEIVVSKLWKHTGAMSGIAIETLLKRLANRSLLYLDTVNDGIPATFARSVSLHDLLHDYGKRIGGDRPGLHRTLLDAYRPYCPNGWPSGPNDGYFFDHLQRHLDEAGYQQELSELLGNSRWLCSRMRVSSIGVSGLSSIMFGEPEQSSGRSRNDAIILIEGLAGIGKTTLALQLLVRMATWGSRCMFLATQCDEARAKALIKRVRLSDWNGEAENPDVSRPPVEIDDGNAITVKAAPWSADTRPSLSDLTKLIPTCMAAVLIDDVESHSIADWQSISLATAFFSTNNILALLVCETQSDDKRDENVIERFADTVLRLDLLGKPLGRQSRTIEVVKGRTDRYKRGQHRFVFKDHSKEGQSGVELVVLPTDQPPMSQID